MCAKRPFLPAGAANCHAHVVGPRARYPVDPSHPMCPPDAPAEELFALQDRFGLNRLVIVQSLAHGFDHAAVIDAIALRRDATRGIALIQADATENDLRALVHAGFVGVRIHVVSHIPGAAGPEELAQVARICADVGWHIQLHAHGNELRDLIGVLKTIPCRAVIDHMAYPAPDMHEAMLRALEMPHVYTKISCPERVNSDDLSLGARHALRLIDHAPEQLVWGTDWPHIGVPDVDEFALVDLLSLYPEDALQNILVGTPDLLYFNGETP